MASGKRLGKGDDVKWSTSQGETRGEVERVATSDVEIKGNRFKASKDDPKVVVKSHKSGAKAAHKPESLKKA
ncbi:DUF2945 domain-containing protein [Marinivivus vitaminiproducens]|uniref:DUF2945 domain-containing protein n=1 Tax=Marinivivus vitaminiproducens TaxID=3035935 RepID=UPI002799BFBD|nr:DUF2945 domain-containing protein [Geminicoccaceae bacterium SCSIO 64248]